MAKAKKKTGQQTSAGFMNSAVAPGKAPDYVVVELLYEAPVGFTATKFVAPAAGDTQAGKLNDVLDRYEIQTLRSHFRLPSEAIRSRVEVASALPKAPFAETFPDRTKKKFIQSGFVQVVPKRDQDAGKIAEELNRQSAVWKAFVAPRPVPAVAGSAAGSRNFEPSQGYLYSAPDGIGAAEVWDLPGGKGAGITICDIEGAWNRRHEDLPTGIKLLGGNMLDDLGWRDHGTAVLGEMVSVPSSKGTVGISHAATAVVQSAYFNGVYNLAGALDNAAGSLKAGDVILIELQAEGPNKKYVAMQYWNDVFSAIKSATEKGITVVEAAGNGDENFDLAIFKNTGLQKDSGAIVVGAGVPPANHLDFEGFGGMAPYASLGAPRSRIWFSNYGKIVNVQAWGWNVATLGYGDAQGGDSENRWYTLRFSGTSSASPIVTGAVACLQGRAKAKNGRPLTPERVREILVRTGTPQEKGSGALQKIGPQPNLVKAMKEV
ncbi:MAG TPA: S8 family serine peptidase [Thermoanaerobaculia bacterium]|jgi:subtilisin family serine protease|nr:S8 family serine peptidase [Thermoanaerobaculia bacterium]